MLGPAAIVDDYLIVNCRLSPGLDVVNALQEKDISALLAMMTGGAVRSRGGVRNPRDAGVWDGREPPTRCPQGHGAPAVQRPLHGTPLTFADPWRWRVDAAARDFGLAARLIMGMARCSSFRPIW